MTTPLLGPADADHYRVKIGKYWDRWYIDPLPTDDIAPATDTAWPSVSNVKAADGKDWSFVANDRTAKHLHANPDALKGLDLYRTKKRIREINDAGLHDAQRRGTDVHTMFEAALRGQVIDHRMLSEEARAYRPAVDAFLHNHQPELVAAELVCIHRGLNGIGYGGTADAIVRINGNTYKVDWKSRGEESQHGAYPEEAKQLGAYAGADYIIVEGNHGPERARMPALDGGLIVSVKPDGYRIYPVDLALAWVQWESLHSHFATKLTQYEAIGHPWAPGNAQPDLFQLIADSDNDREAFNDLYYAHKNDWTPAATAAVRARLSGTQTPSLAVVK